MLVLVCNYVVHDDVAYAIQGAFFGLTFGALLILQLEMRFVFSVLFAKILLHDILMEPEYVGNAIIYEGIMGWWWMLGIALHAVILSFVGVVQGYLIIRAILTTSKRISAQQSARKLQEVVLSLVITIVSEVAGLSTFVYFSAFVSQREDPVTYWILNQFAITCLAVEAIAETVALLTMMDLVAGKVLLMRPVSFIAKKLAVPRTSIASRSRGRFNNNRQAVSRQSVTVRNITQPVPVTPANTLAATESLQNCV
ncbi:hypothetical protein HK105_203108 [Polyrhizophydium stewartii]|uniref:Uncharacterized protein n=1 Tax=Polyrhizophydium stewartii TaxID=2732419 RepID=A0ABR4ND69_9FUNG